MVAALRSADLEPAQIGYINLHGTASQANDLIEGQVVGQLFPSSTVCSSTKGWTAHTLGAAGITEALICLQALEQGLAPATLNTENLDPQVSLNLALSAQPVASRFAMTNSFGFGGNNCSLVFAKESA
jgi:3-oxoacyl-[acyl-carrier-protein] synthase-1